MRRKKLPPPPTAGKLELSFGAGQYGGLSAAGLLGMIPATTWLMMLVIPMDLDVPGSPVAALLQNTVISVIAMIVTQGMILVAPWLIPCLVLRARQPNGARIEWDEVTVTEWDGGWKRAVILWKEAVASHRVWSVTARMATTTYEALQLVDPLTGAAITVWTSEPAEVTAIRRRLCVPDVGPLRTAIAAHKIELRESFDPALAAVPGRESPEWRVWIGRLGYFGGVFAPLVAGPAPMWGILLATLSTACLGLRSVTAFAEMRFLLANSPQSAEHRRAELLRLRAVIAEVVVRGACVLLVPISTAVSVFVLPI